MSWIQAGCNTSSGPLPGKMGMPSLMSQKILAYFLLCVFVTSSTPCLCIDFIGKKQPIIQEIPASFKIFFPYYNKLQTVTGLGTGMGKFLDSWNSGWGMRQGAARKRQREKRWLPHRRALHLLLALGGSWVHQDHLGRDPLL